MDKTLILEGVLEAQSIKRDDDGRLRFVGLAMRDNTLSANKWFYDAAFIDESVRRTNEWIEAGNVSTSYPTHGQALGSFMSMPTHKPVGKIERFWREGNAMLYEAVISPTSEGADVMRLIADKVVAHTSIRSSMFESKTVKMMVNGEKQDVEKPAWAIINGVDFCDQPGVAGAGIVKVLESAPTFVEASEDTMDFNDLTLEALRQERPDLLNSLVVEHLGLLQGQIQEKEAAIAALTAQLEGAIAPETVTALEAQVQEKDEALAAALAETALWQECAVPLVEKMVELRRADPQLALEDARAQAIASLNPPKDETNTETNEPENDSLMVAEGVPESFHKLVAVTAKLGR
jgi:hypothetical protein